MKNKAIVLITVIFLIFGVFAYAEGNQDNSGTGQTNSGVQQVVNRVPFSRGFNFGNWLEIVGGDQILFNRYNEQDFIDIKSLGADVIRLPVHFHFNIGREPDYIIDPTLLKHLDMAVDWAEKHEIYLIIDFHPFEHVVGLERYNEILDKMLIPIWAQVAQRYRNRSEYVIYEILNEPDRSLTARRWGELQGRVIETIRRYDTKHSIIVTSAANTGMGSSISDLNSIPQYSDTNLIYTFHFYDPWIFTSGQGSSQFNTESLVGIPFPYDRSRMPAMPSAIRNTWVGDMFNRYSREGNPADIYRTLDRAVAFSRQRNVPIICGEFSVSRRGVLQEDRIRWYQTVAAALDERGISRIHWDYLGYDSAGVFNVMGGDFNSDLDVEVIRALGFTPPPQRPREPLRSDIIIYDDYLHKGMRIWSAGSGNLYYTPAAQGEYSIYSPGDISIYLSLQDRNFPTPVFDFSYLAQNDFVLEFKARSQSPAALEVEFYHFEDNIEWSNRFNNQIPLDGMWQTIRIPLKDMVLNGGWDNEAGQWHSDTRGRVISWSNITRLRFETRNRTGFYLDDIKITR